MGPLALWVAGILSLIYALAAPLGDRVLWVATWATATLTPEEQPGSAKEAAVYEGITRGWTSFLRGDLWILLLLGTVIALFTLWWVAFLLPVLALSTRLALRFRGPYPKKAGWYLERFRKGALGHAEVMRKEEDAEGEAWALELARALEELRDRHGEERVPDPGLGRKQRSAKEAPGSAQSGKPV
ncbi:MAG: hypothetical protein EA422_12010 [Gemmatimonadales bacterium]|nr:MAG: hypothetical protein EA422_12010 [Gemmatimonadales bacterium]